MKSTMTVVGAAMIGAALIAAPAGAQQPSTSQGQQQAEDPNAIKTHTPNVSRRASKALQALQKAVNENDTAAIPAALAEAQAAASTADDRYAIAIMQLKAAASAKDNAAIAAAIEAMLASGSVTEDEKFSLYMNLANTYAAMKTNDRATQAYQQALQRNPASVDATAGLAEAKVAQGQAAEAVALLEKGIQLQAAGGAKASETWYKRAVAVAYNAKLPQAVDLSRKWVAAYPTTDAWQNSLAIFQTVAELDEARTLDLLRLKRAARVLTPSDYFTYGDIAVRKGFAGEAKAVLEEGFAANAVKRSDPSFSQLYALATERTKRDRESLPAAPSASANSRQTMTVGDAYFGYGDYAKAVEFYRAALGKEGADANLINLHLGMALARQGDRAGAEAALKAAGGDQAGLAAFWQLYASTRA